MDGGEENSEKCKCYVRKRSEWIEAGAMTERTLDGPTTVSHLFCHPSQFLLSLPSAQNVPPPPFLLQPHSRHFSNSHHPLPHPPILYLSSRPPFSSTSTSPSPPHPTPHLCHRCPMSPPRCLLSGREEIRLLSRSARDLT